MYLSPVWTFIFYIYACAHGRIGFPDLLPHARSAVPFRGYGGSMISRVDASKVKEREGDLMPIDLLLCRRECKAFYYALKGRAF
ncbi:uncharacterized [Tachysurus ichikawai]